MICFPGFAQIQDKEQSQVMVDLAGEMLKASQAEDDVRDIMVQAADLDTTNIQAILKQRGCILLPLKKMKPLSFCFVSIDKNPSTGLTLNTT